MGAQLARHDRFSLVPLGRFRRCRRCNERLVALSSWCRRANGIHSDRNGHALFHPGLALRRIFPLAAGLRSGNDVAVDCGDAICRRPGRAALSSDLAPLLWLGIFSALRWTFGRFVHIGYALDDWYFARDFIHRVRPELRERLDRLAHALVRLIHETDADEVIVDGHSLGAPLSLVVIDRALQLDPQLRTGIKRLHIVSTGSSLLKVALHPAAGWLREAVGRVASTPAVYWVEYQALVDIINVYKVDPVAALGLPPTGKPSVKIFRIRMMVEEHTYRRFHLNFLRIHRQAVMGNERRYFY